MLTEKYENVFTRVASPTLSGIVYNVSLPNMNHYVAITPSGVYSCNLEYPNESRNEGTIDGIVIDDEIDMSILKRKRISNYSEYTKGIAQGFAKTVSGLGWKILVECKSRSILVCDKYNDILFRHDSDERRTCSFASFDENDNLLVVLINSRLHFYRINLSEYKKSSFLDTTPLCTRIDLLTSIHTHYMLDEPRLIYSDWLEENGDIALAEFVRLQCYAAKCTKQIDGSNETDVKMSILEKEHLVDWLLQYPESSTYNIRPNAVGGRLLLGNYYSIGHKFYRGFPIISVTYKDIVHEYEYSGLRKLHPVDAFSIRLRHPNTFSNILSMHILHRAIYLELICTEQSDISELLSLLSYERFHLLSKLVISGTCSISITRAICRNASLINLKHITFNLQNYHYLSKDFEPFANCDLAGIKMDFVSYDSSRETNMERIVSRLSLAFRVEILDHSQVS